MHSFIRNLFAFFILITGFQSQALATGVGNISGQLILDGSWERKIYISLIEDFNSEYTISNSLIVSSVVIDANGFFNIELDNIPQNWSLLRLHLVKKGETPNSLTIGGINETFMFLIARRNSEIRIKNTEDLPVFRNVTITGADYMETFRYVRKLMHYPNSIDYRNAMIEKEFIVDAVNEKLKIVADTCTHPLVSLYALHQTDFQGNITRDKHFYNQYLEKWKTQDNVYFNAFRRNFPQLASTYRAKTNTDKTFWWIGLGVLAIALIFIFVLKQNKKNSITLLSVKEREIFELLQKGMSNKEISAKCNIELTTVKSHVSSIYSKLKIRSRKEAMDLKIK